MDKLLKITGRAGRKYVMIVVCILLSAGLFACKHPSAENAKTTDRWCGKNLVCFGDSREYYDGRTYWDSAKPEWAGKPYVGYQQRIRDLLSMTVTTVAAPGRHSYQICDAIKSYDFSGVDACLFDGGINDWNDPQERDAIGELAPIGSAFNTTTRYGNWQSAVEYVLTNYPEVKIYLCVPYIGWDCSGDSEREFPYSEAKIKKDVAELYNIPCIDLYKCASVNISNRAYYYADARGYIHFNDYGNELIGDIIADFIQNN